MDYLSGTRRRTSEKSGHDNDEAEARSERWLISYSDLITTLMVLFLALYVLELARNKELEIKAFEAHVVKERAADANANSPSAPAEGREAARKKLLSLLQGLSDEKEITVKNDVQGVEIAINAKILFRSGDAHLLPDSFDVLNQVAAVLKKNSTGNILVEGHTDSAPISTAKYESNWELSSARAGAVVRFFADRGIEPHRLAAIGRADNFPLVIGDDAAARAANRRVTILVQL